MYYKPPFQINQNLSTGFYTSNPIEYSNEIFQLSDLPYDLDMEASELPSEVKAYEASKNSSSDTSDSNTSSGFNVGKLMNGITGAAGTIGKWVGDLVEADRSQVDLSGMNYNTMSLNTPYDIANAHTHMYDTNSINAPKAGKQALNIFTKMNEGAAAGSQINMPWGTIAGAAAGLTTGIGQAFMQNATYRNDVAKGNYANSLAAPIANRMVAQGINRLFTMNGISDRFNRFEQGGTMNSQYSNQELYNTNNNLIDSGGIHEQNPYGGVQLGTDGDGTPNLVEEGEVVYTDLDSNEKRVFSNRITPDPELFAKHNLNSNLVTESYALSAKKIIDMFEGRNDPFSNKTKNLLLNRLFEAQEEQKINEAAAANGMTPEEYIALVQEQQAQVQAAQQQAAMQQQAQQMPLQNEMGMQMQQPVQDSMGMYESPMQQDIYGNYGALGGVLEYGPEVYYDPLLGYDSYLLQRSRVNTHPVNTYEGGGPVLTGKADIQTLEDSMKYLYNNDPSEFDNIVNQYNKLNNTNYDRSTYFSKSSDGVPGPIHDYNMYYLGNIPIASPKSTSASGWDIPDYLFNPSEFPIEEIEPSEFPTTDSPKTKSGNTASNWDRARNALGIMNPLRFVGAADAFASWVSPEKLDTWYSDFLRGEYNPIPYTGPIGRHQVFQPVDAYRNLGVMQSARAAAISRNNEYSPNSRLNTAANMAVDRVFNNQFGDMYAHETQHNFDRLNNVTAYNNQLDQYNDERLRANHQYNTQHRANTVGQAAMVREASKDARKAAIDQARDTYIKNLQNIGQELSYRSYVDSNPSLAYDSFNSYKTAFDYDLWLRRNDLEDSPENWDLFMKSR